MTKSKRESCPKCLRPTSHCYCPLLPSFKSGIEILILRHHSEVDHPFNSVKMIDLAIANVTVLDGEHFEEQVYFQRFLKKKPYLIFPGDDAHSLESFKRPIKRIILIDGTWKKAKKIFFLNPGLQRLPMISIDTKNQSEYLIRKTSVPGGLSTLEALCEIGKKFDDNQSYETLERSFIEITKLQAKYKIKEGT